jgi:molybdate transport system substrate-binding protein
MATRHVLAELAAAAASTGLPRVDIESVGGVDAARRVAAGEQVDLVFLAEDALAALADAGHVDRASLTPLFVSHVAAAVRSSASPLVPAGAHAFVDAGAMREAVRSAGRIGYSTGPSGTALLALIEEWGLTDELTGRLVQARPGVPVARLVAEGDVDLGIQQLSELVGQPGIEILGTLPPDCAIDTVFAGAVASASADAVAAREVLAFLASEGVAEIVDRHSFESARR